MAQQAAGVNKIWIGICFCLVACSKPAPIKRQLCDLSKSQLHTSRGITRMNQSPEPFSGLAYRLQNGKDTLERMEYLQGKAHGQQRSYYPNLKPKEFRNFVYGHQEGQALGWFEDGKPMFEYNFKNDLFHGALREWHPNGQLFRKLHYKEGHEDGLQQSWNAEGKIKINYLIKDDRRYGLLGTKNCKTVSDSMGH